ncbi:DinI-like family protein [Serratia odorifera]|uniref:DinI-like family protein n=1 Tax=Serratia odorifera TaxID=618 RepID=UPI003D2D6188
MFVELVFDKRNVADLRVKPMQANGLNTDASKTEKEKLNRMLEDMFEESDQWLATDI